MVTPKTENMKKQDFTAKKVWETEFNELHQKGKRGGLSPHEKERLRDLSKIRQQIRKK